MENQDFNTTILVDKTPQEAFDAITNVSAWWSDEIEGNTSELNDVFDYHFEDIHRCKIKLVEVTPNKKMVWHVLENYFKPGIFDDASGRAHDPKGSVDGKAEWVDTKIIFEISERAGGTQVKFTHQGLVPEYECFNACSNGWTFYIQQSLRSLITTGTGEPNSTGKPKTTDEKKLKLTTDFTTTLWVDESPKVAFTAIQNVRGWWSGLHAEEFEGTSNKLNDEFSFLAGGGAHYTKQKLVELIPDRRIVWLVTESKLTFVENETEWTGTKICFDISADGDKTRIVFTHKGLVPEFECYDSCAPAWTQYIEERLLREITSGKRMLVDNLN